MKSITQIIIGASAALFIGCVSSHAENWSDNLYLHTDIGPSFIQDTGTHFHRTTIEGGSTRGRGTFRTDAGIRGDLSVGYSFTKSLGIELESGVLANPGPSRWDDFYQIPIMLRAIYQIPINDSWKAYFGAGVGEVVSIDQTILEDPAFHTIFKVQDTELSFGYEAEAGIKYKASRQIEIGLGYKFLAVDQSQYHFEPIPHQEVLNVRVNDLYNHTAFLSFTWKF